MRAKGKPVICLMGPTAVGKTALAVNLMQKLPFEIISVDSVMIYRGMDIGSAKPSAEELKIAPHHLIDIRDPSQRYSAADFCTDALQIIGDIFLRGKIPLLTGGTMMYFNSLQQGLSTLPKADHKLRRQITEEAEQKGWSALHARLASLDPETAQRIHSNDAQRIQRALEIIQLTGCRLLELYSLKKQGLPDCNFINIAIVPKDRSLLHRRIEKRFKEMLQGGLIEEVEALYKRKDNDLNENLPSIRAVGYRQVWQYLNGKINKEEMEEKAIAATRQLAKRQLTWLRSWPNVRCFTEEDNDDLEMYVKAAVRDGSCYR
jgi:tRNA dimethylallyltransferase